MSPTDHQVGDPVPNTWILTWWLAWTGGHGGRPFFDHETGRVLWRMRKAHRDVLTEEMLRADPDRYEEIPPHGQTSEQRMRERAAAWLRERGWEPSWSVEVEFPYGRWEDHWSDETELVEAYRETFPDSDGPHLRCCSRQMVHEAVLSGEDIRYWEAPPGVSL